MMAPRQVRLLILASVLLIAVLVLAVNALRGGILGRGLHEPEIVQTTNLALDVRYDFDFADLTPAPFDDRAEYPLRLDGPDWSFYGKRIQGLGTMLAKAPSAMLYDFVGSQHVDNFEQWYRLKLVDEPVYEDTYIKGELALHQQLTYQRTERSRGWPVYFPQSVIGDNNSPEPRSIKEVRRDAKVEERLYRQTGLETAYVEGWAFFTDADLFLFQAVSATALTAAQRQTCVSIMESLEFDVLIDSEGRTGLSNQPEGGGSDDPPGAAEPETSPDPGADSATGPAGDAG